MMRILLGVLHLLIRLHIIVDWGVQCDSIAGMKTCPQVRSYDARSDAERAVSHHVPIFAVLVCSMRMVFRALPM
jgi:hypothetical protein